MNQEDYKIAYENVLEANKMLNKTIDELRESIINWDIDYYGLTSEEDKQRLQELKDILEINEDTIDKDIKWYLIEEQEDEKTKVAQINMNFKILREKLIEIIDCINRSDEA